MEHFGLPPPGLVVVVVMVFVVVPLAVVLFLPLAAFRHSFRRHHARWVHASAHVVHGAYRGSTVLLEGAPRVPWIVVAASLLSLYLATPVAVALPFAVAAAAMEGVSVAAALAFDASLVMIAGAVVGYAILRPSRERAVAVIAAYRDASSVTYATIACSHAIVLFAAAAANERGNVRACA